MNHTYTIPQASRPEVEKAVARYMRKAERYGTPFAVKYGAPYAKRIPIYDVDHGVKHPVGNELIEVFDMTINSEIIQKDGYSVIAKIEHLDGGNVVSSFVDEMRKEWTTASSKCEHCGRNRFRAVTFIVRHEDGSEKQVGRGCLKEYCGINPQRLGINNELNEILLNSDIYHHDYDFEEQPVSRVYQTVEVLALAMRVISKYGYVRSDERNSNKNRIWGIMDNNERPSADEIRQAEEFSEAVASIDDDSAFTYNLDHIKSLIKSGYCKRSHVGRIAYAPIAYEKYLEDMRFQAERDAAKNAERQASNYVGEIGKRILIDVADMVLLTSWDTQWGTTWLYKFTDTNGNVLIWFASNPLQYIDEFGFYRNLTSVERIKATVKEHTERDGVKQTIITRCKAA